MTFDGFSEAAFDFYDDLEVDNSKVFWEANKGVYASAVRAPMVALTEGACLIFCVSRAERTRSKR